jgi:hypothetical protein
MTPPHVSTARALIGKRWRHRGRGPTWFDCLGLIVVSLHANGRMVTDRKQYGREPHKDGLREALQAEFGAPLPAPVVGSIGLFRGDEYPLHVGIFGDYPLGGLSLIHSSNDPTVRCVTEHRYAGEMAERFIEAYDPGVPLGA